jgi:hypothetical protein
MRALLIGAAIALASGLLSPARAVVWDKTTDFFWSAGTGNITGFPGPGSGNIWSQGAKTPTSTGPRWTGPTKQLPFNPSPTANFKASFTAGNMAKSIVNPTMAIPLIAAPLLNYLLTEACVRLAGGSMDLAPGGQWEECRYTNQTIGTSTFFGAGGDHKSTAAEACQSAVSVNFSPSAPSQVTAPTNIQGPDDFRCEYKPNPFANWEYWSNGRGYWGCSLTSSHTQKTFANQNSPVPPNCGTSLVRDGWQPSTAQAAESAVTTQLQQWTQCDFLYGYGSCADFDNKSSGGVLDEIMTSGGSIDATLEAPTVQTPLMDPPIQTTQTDADGKTVSSTEQTQNDYSCIVIDAGKAVQCSQYKKKTTTTATTSNPNGTGTVTTTATAVTTQTANPKAEAKCEPGTIACSQMGTPPEAEPMATKTVNVSMTEDSGWSLAPATCPAPKSVTLAGKQYSFSLSAMCDFATGIRPMIVAMAYLTATLLFFGLARRSD